MIHSHLLQVPLPRFVNHESLSQRLASELYDPEKAADASQFESTHMPDDVTRDTCKRMHYAAYRAHQAKNAKERSRWRATYLDLRDRIVLGNRKLVFQAVRRRMAASNKADDVIGDCQIVLIHAVAAFNPWLGIRFSTYAYTCLLRAMARMARKAANDWFERSTTLDQLADNEPGCGFDPEPVSNSLIGVFEFLRDDHPLLSRREKMILSRRFGLTEQSNAPTLENVGRELGLSKERVRQVQANALGKLRQVLLGKVIEG